MCSTCCRIKPRYATPLSTPPLIRALRPFDRLSIDFKGPLPPSAGSVNRYIFIVVDEYSRFPFAFPCKDLSSETVRRCLSEIFSTFGLPSYVHSDRGTAFMSSDVRTFLLELGIACSRTTPFHPQGNGQCKKYVGIVWKTILLALEARNLAVSQWEHVLHEALHSIRSLLCTSTNTTPHELLFNYERRAYSGTSIPSWLLSPGKALLRRFVRSKTDPYVVEVDLLETTPTYAHVRFPSGREDTVSLRDLAPAGTPLVSDEDLPSSVSLETPPTSAPDASPEIPVQSVVPSSEASSAPAATPSRSSRESRPVRRLQYDSLGGR